MQLFFVKKIKNESQGVAGKVLYFFKQLLPSLFLLGLACSNAVQPTFLHYVINAFFKEKERKVCSELMGNQEQLISVNVK